MTRLRPIPTSYAGVTFRSRLEADWAFHLSSLGIAWSYEPEGVDLPGGTRYLPDFWIPRANTWLEAKGPGVPGIEKTDALRDAVTPQNEPWMSAMEQAVVIGLPAIGSTIQFKVACRYCGAWISSKPRFNGILDTSIASIEDCRSCDFRGFVTYDLDHCGMESRCWICGDKTSRLPAQLNVDRFWRLPRTPQRTRGATVVEQLVGPVSD